MNCIFCEMKDYILENELAYAIYDKYPVGKGHMLFIPKRHVKNFFDITKEERKKVQEYILFLISQRAKNEKNDK